MKTIPELEKESQDIKKRYGPWDVPLHIGKGVN